MGSRLSLPRRNYPDSLVTDDAPVSAASVASGIDHGALTGLGDDDHIQYILVAGTRAFTGNQAMGAHKFTGLSAGSGAGDSVRYEQVLLLTGGTMAGNIAMGSNKLTGLAAGSGAGDSVRYEQVLLLAGGTMAGNIAMGSNKLTGLAAGTANGDSVRFEQNCIPLRWSASGTQNQALTRYLPVSGGANGNATENNVKMRINRAYKLMNFRVWMISNNISVSPAVTFNLRVNAGYASPAVTLTYNADVVGEQLDDSTVFTGAAGDFIDWEIVTGAEALAFCNFSVVECDLVWI